MYNATVIPERSPILSQAMKSNSNKQQQDDYGVTYQLAQPAAVDFKYRVQCIHYSRVFTNLISATAPEQGQETQNN